MRSIGTSQATVPENVLNFLPLDELHLSLLQETKKQNNECSICEEPYASGEKIA
jgi:hypothetical protein